MDNIAVQIALACVIFVALGLIYFKKTTSDWIDHHEKQGFTVLPGSRNLMGIMDLYNNYSKLRASDQVMEVGFIWFLKEHW